MFVIVEVLLRNKIHKCSEIRNWKTRQKSSKDFYDLQKLEILNRILGVMANFSYKPDYIWNQLNPKYTHMPMRDFLEWNIWGRKTKWKSGHSFWWQIIYKIQKEALTSACFHPFCRQVHLSGCWGIPLLAYFQISV